MRDTFQNSHELQLLVRERGLLPFFAGEIPSFSIEEFCPNELWFADDAEGPWEWKSDVIVYGDCAYGKFFRGKAGFISMDYFPDFVNYRRSVAKLSEQETEMLHTIEQHHSLLSKEIKALCGYVKPRQKRVSNPLEKLVAKDAKKLLKQPKSQRESYETAITRLQMATRVVTADFEYNVNKEGKRYGWGVARYCTPEDFFGAERLRCDRSAMQSFDRLVRHLRDVLPWASDAAIRRLIE